MRLVLAVTIFLNSLTQCLEKPVFAGDRHETQGSVSTRGRSVAQFENSHPRPREPAAHHDFQPFGGFFFRLRFGAHAKRFARGCAESASDFRVYQNTNLHRGSPSTWLG